MSRRTQLFAAALALALTGSARAADPGVIEIPGTDTTIKFNGFAETALIYQLSGGYPNLATACDYYLCAPSIALSGVDTHTPQMAMTAAYTRLGVQTSTPSDVGAIGYRMEFDAAKTYQLIGQSATHSSFIRIRHAYGTVGDFLLIGQTWSTFADLNAFLDQMDENPVANLTANRAPQIRLTIPAGVAKVSLALEDPYGTSIGKAGIWNIPDVIARVDVPFSMGSFSVRGVAKQYKTAAADTFGFGAAVGAKVKLGADTLVFDVSGGPGIGGYVFANLLAANNEDVVINGSKMETWTVLGGSLGFTHVWTDKVRSNLMGSAVVTKDDGAVRDAVNATATATSAPYGAYNRNVYSFGFNTYFQVAKNFWAGPELWYSYRKTMDGSHGDELRALATAHFNLM